MSNCSSDNCFIEFNKRISIDTSTTNIENKNGINTSLSFITDYFNDIYDGFNILGNLVTDIDFLFRQKKT